MSSVDEVRFEAACVKLTSLAAQFSEKEMKRSWLIDGLLVENEGCFLAGPKKSLKTSIAVDLAVSLTTGTPFLGHFPVNGRRQVLFFSGESDLATFDEILAAVSAARGVEVPRKGVWVFPTVPQLREIAPRELDRRISKAHDEVRAKFDKNEDSTAAQHKHQALIGQRNSGIFRELHFDRMGWDRFPELLAAFKDAGDATGNRGAVILDPLYFAIRQGSNTSDLATMGQQLAQIVNGDLAKVGTVIVLHHATKHLYPGRPMELDDLASAGCAEFCRQWMLVNRRAAFNPARDHTNHRLSLNYGGSAGHCGLVAVDIESRKWQVAVKTLDEAKADDAAARKLKTKVKVAATAEARVEKLLAVLSDEPISLNEAGRRGKMNSASLGAAIKAAGRRVLVAKNVTGKGQTLRLAKAVAA